MIGIKCENHTCSILAAGFLLGEEKSKTLNEHKKRGMIHKMIMKVDQEEKVRNMLTEAQCFIWANNEWISHLSEEEIKKYREKISSL